MFKKKAVLHTAPEAPAGTQGSISSVTPLPSPLPQPTVADMLFDLQMQYPNSHWLDEYDQMVLDLDRKKLRVIWDHRKNFDYSRLFGVISLFKLLELPSYRIEEFFKRLHSEEKQDETTWLTLINAYLKQSCCAPQLDQIPIYNGSPAVKIMMGDISKACESSNYCKGDIRQRLTSLQPERLYIIWLHREAMKFFINNHLDLFSEFTELNTKFLEYIFSRTSIMSSTSSPYCARILRKCLREQEEGVQQTAPASASAGLPKTAPATASAGLPSAPALAEGPPPYSPYRDASGAEVRATVDNSETEGWLDYLSNLSRQAQSSCRIS